MIVTIILGLAAAYLLTVVLLHLRKSRQKGRGRSQRIAFFHPFW